MARTPGAKAVDDAAAVALDGVESESIRVKHKAGRQRRSRRLAPEIPTP